MQRMHFPFYVRVVEHVGVNAELEANFQVHMAITVLLTLVYGDILALGP
jgi:hypothetical protein